MLSNKIPIVLAFTPNYLVPAAVCIRSIIDNAAIGTPFHFICLLSEPLPITAQKELEIQVSTNSPSTVSFLDMYGKLADIYVVDKYTIAASYRLLLPDLLPECNKVLYVDCDMIIQNDVAKLFIETDLENYYMAGVMEATLPEQEEHLYAIGCEPGQYMNSGFLLMNLQKLRADNMVRKFLEASKNEDLEFPDQDVINILCKDYLLGLAPFWNSIRTFLIPQYKNNFLKYYTESNWIQAQNHGNVHYTGPKPWNGFTIKFDLWWHYYEKLPAVIRRKYKIDKRVFYFFKIYDNALGKRLISRLQTIYRSLKTTR